MRIASILAIALFILSCNNHTKEDKTAETDKVTTETVSQTPAPEVDNVVVPVTDTIRYDTLFKAVGVEPFWSITILKDREIVFNSADGTEVRIPEYVATTDEKKVTRYMAAKDRKTIVMSVTRNKCSDGMSEIVYDFEVLAVVNTVTYRGCGSYK